ncbi:MAG: hypothetical protein QM755_12720 [Luteolibacter sp.]
MAEAQRRQSASPTNHLMVRWLSRNRPSDDAFHTHQGLVDGNPPERSAGNPTA